MCFDIQIKTQCANTTDRTVFIDSLPMLLAQGISNAADKNDTAVQLVAVQKSFALSIMRDDVRAYLASERISKQSRMQPLTTAQAGTQTKLNTLQMMRGIHVSLAVPSRYAKIAVGIVTVLGAQDGSNVIIKDANHAIVWQSTTTSGKVAVNQSFAPPLWIVSTAPSVTSTAPEKTYCCGLSAAVNDALTTGQALLIAGHDGVTTTVKEHHGIIAEIQIECDTDAILCNFAEALTTALLYKTAAGIAEAIATSTAINYFVLNSTEMALSYADKWQTEYEKRLAQAMPEIVRTLKQTPDLICAKCRNSTVNLIPA